MAEMVAVGLAWGEVGCSGSALAVAAAGGVDAPAKAEVAAVTEAAILWKKVVNGETEAAEMRWERVEGAWLEASAETAADCSSPTKRRDRLVL